MPKGVKRMQSGVEGDAESEAGTVDGFVGLECNIGNAVGIPVVNKPIIGAAPHTVGVERDNIAHVGKTLESETEAGGGAYHQHGGVAGVVVAYSAWIIDCVAFTGIDPYRVAGTVVHYDVVVAKCGEVVGLQVAPFGEWSAADAELIVCVGEQVAQRSVGSVGGEGGPGRAGRVTHIPWTVVAAVVHPLDLCIVAVDMEEADFFYLGGVLVDVNVEAFAIALFVGAPTETQEPVLAADAEPFAVIPCPIAIQFVVIVFVVGWVRAGPESVFAVVAVVL